MALDRYVWIWQPGDRHPTLCGHLRWDGRAASFAYVRSYRERTSGFSIEPEWPLTTPLGARLFPAEDDPLPGAIADVAPGRWGEYVFEKRFGRRLNPMESLIEGFGDRTGAIELSESSAEPPAPEPAFVPLEEIARIVEAIDQGRKVDPKHLLLFRHGPSLGGRRPKASVRHDGRAWIAKFVSVKDRDDLQPRREAFGLALAKAAGITVPAFEIIEVRGKPVLLVERFDREADGRRAHILSARSLQHLSERQMLEVASYPVVAQMLRRSADKADTAAEWYRRMVFNIVLGNTDDHALNHLFRWDGQRLALMPAFDLEQQPLDEQRTQEMIVGTEGKRSTFRNALSAAGEFGLRRAEAVTLIDRLVAICLASWKQAIERAGIDDADAISEIRRTLHFEDR